MMETSQLMLDLDHLDDYQNAMDSGQWFSMGTLYYSSACFCSSR